MLSAENNEQHLKIMDELLRLASVDENLSRLWSSNSADRKFIRYATLNSIDAFKAPPTEIYPQRDVKFDLRVQTPPTEIYPQRDVKSD